MRSVRDLPSGVACALICCGNQFRQRLRDIGDRARFAGVLSTNLVRPVQDLSCPLSFPRESDLPVPANIASFISRADSSGVPAPRPEPGTSATLVLRLFFHNYDVGHSARTARYLEAAALRPTAYAAEAVPMLRWPYDHHRDLRTRLRAEASPHTCPGSDQNRHLNDAVTADRKPQPDTRHSCWLSRRQPLRSHRTARSDCRCCQISSPNPAPPLLHSCARTRALS